jgi:hypothetical protein
MRIKDKISCEEYDGGWKNELKKLHDEIGPVHLI